MSETICRKLPPDEHLVWIIKGETRILNDVHHVLFRLIFHCLTPELDSIVDHLFKYHLYSFSARDRATFFDKYLEQIQAVNELFSK